MATLDISGPPGPMPQPPGGAPQQTLPGTTTTLPIGKGIEGLINVNPPFRSNAPKWFTPSGTVWGQLGCAVPEPGRYIQTNNGVIYDFVQMVGRSLFDVMWRYDDRKFDRFPSRDCLWEIHQLLIIGRNRLAVKTVAPNDTPLLPTHAKPSPQMFTVFPVPFYGPLGCINQWLRRCAELAMMMETEAMQNSDNEYGFHITPAFKDATYPYLKYLLVDMAAKFFGMVDPKVTRDDSFVIPDAAWQTYDPTKFSVSVEATASRPPMGYTPTDLDLEPIRGIPIEQAVPFLQPWPDAQLKYSTGGIWAASSSPAGDATAANGGVAAAPLNTGNAILLKTGGPPSAV